MKKCKDCEEYKSEELFGKNSAMADGLGFYCKPCKKKRDRRDYQKHREVRLKSVANYRLENPEKVKESKKKEYITNKDKYITNKDKYITNKDKYLNRSKTYYEANRTRVLAENKAKRESDPDYYKGRYRYVKTKSAQDPGFRAILNTRQRVAQFMGSKPIKYSKKLGCSKEQFMLHIESLFQPGMTWENYGEWEIDHKYPLSVAYEEGPEPFRKACLYMNLQPLWLEQNRKKSNKIS
jgi:hypothetical protein